VGANVLKAVNLDKLRGKTVSFATLVLYARYYFLMQVVL